MPLWADNIYICGQYLFDIAVSICNMLLKANIYIFIILTLTVLSARGQSYFTSTEYGIALGGSQYFGDLNENYGFQTVSPALGVYVRKHMNPYIALKAVANYTTVGYDDKYNTDPYEVARNLNFKSVVFEVAVQAEFNFFKFLTGDVEHRFTPYLTGGIGGFYYNPYTYYNGIKYYLQPLGTEGQNAGYSNRQYSNYAVCFPIGAGVKFWLRAGLNLSFEVADRLTTTDYLDDVSSTYVGSAAFTGKNGNPVALALQNRSTTSGTTLGELGKQRGNSSNNDQYMLAMLSVSWHFTTYRCPQYLRSDMIRVY